jgi:hypothetical protein
MKLSIKTLHDQLVEDKWRKDNPFEEHILTTSRILNSTWTSLDEKETAIGAWLQFNQPCVFGKVAAKCKRVHYCILTSTDLRENDAFIQAKIHRERKIWQQLALTGEVSAAHSFLLLVCCDRVMSATPDYNLKHFATHLQSLITRDQELDDHGNDRSFQNIFLKHPSTGDYYKFKVIMDFFSAAGDGRWWVDHRVPGGIAFSFNSLGHMIRTQEWYQSSPDRLAWATKLAMTTIDSAAKHPKHGVATWLIDIGHGKPLKHTKCPFADVEKLPAKLKGKDWTAYEGFHHTDHSVRAEFFVNRPGVPTRNRPWRMDFSYIYSRTKEEDSEIVDGVIVTENVVYSELGSPDEWRIAAPKLSTTPFEDIHAIDNLKGSTSRRPIEVELQIQRDLAVCRSWEMDDAELQTHFARI